MKKHLKKLLTLVVALVVVLSAVPVSAKTITNVSARRTVYLQPHLKNHSVLIGWFHPEQKVKFSYDKKIGTVKSTLKDGYGYYFYSFQPKKAGKTTLVTTYLNDYTSIKPDTEIDKQPVTILNYQNPVSSAKLGSHTISASRFNKTDIAYTSYNLFSKKLQPLKIAPKKGWVITNIWIENARGKYIKSLYRYDIMPGEKPSSKSASTKFRAYGGKKNYTINIDFSNQKSNATVTTKIVFR